MTKSMLRQWAIAALLLVSTNVLGQTAGTIPSAGDAALTYDGIEPYASQWTPYDTKNIAWEKRVWRTIDANAAGNEVLNKMSPSGNFAGRMLDDAQNGRYNIYGDDRWMNKLAKEAVRKDFNPAQVSKYRIRETWMYLIKEHKLIVRIIGIAPLRQVIAVDGVTTEEPVFWLYYPEIHAALAQQKITGNPGVENLDQWFWTRQFVSTVERTEDGPIRANGSAQGLAPKY